MSSIGVLSLEINSNSTAAENSLRRLEGALIAIKAATNNTGLNKVASALKRINESINVHTITNLNGLVASMEKLKSACNFTVPNLSGLNRVRTAMEGMSRGAQAARQTQEAVEGISYGFETAVPELGKVMNGIEQLNSAMKEVSQTKEKMFDFSKFDPAKLPIGALGMKLSETNRELLEFGGIVKETFEDVRQMGSQQLLKNFIDNDGIKSNIQTIDSMKSHVIELYSQWKVAVQEGRKAAEKWESVMADTNSTRGQKIAAQDEYRAAEDAVMRLHDAMLTLDKQAVQSAQAMHVSYKSITAAAERHKQAVYEELAAEKTAVRDREMTITQLRQLEFYEKNYANLTNKDRSSFKERFTDNKQMLQAIELIEQRATAQERLNDAVAQAGNTTMGINEETRIGNVIDVENIGEGITLLDKLREKLVILQKEFADKLIKGKLDDKGINDYEIKIIRLRDEIDKLREKYDAINQNSAMVIKREEAIAATEEYIKSNNELSLMKRQLEEMKTQYGQGILSGTLDIKGILSGKKAIEDMTRKVKELEKESGVFHNLMSIAGKLVEPYKKLGDQIKNIAKRMAIRSAIRLFVQGLKEGVENFYYWSKAMGTDFAPMMDKAATSILNLKNSLGSMAAELMATLMPAFENIISVVITAVNWLNQFFAAASGKDSYTEYVINSKAVEAFNNQAKAAKKASGAVKELLADWDELNIIQSESGGSGSSGAGFPMGEYVDKPISSPSADFLGGLVNTIFGGVMGLFSTIGILSIIKKIIKPAIRIGAAGADFFGSIFGKNRKNPTPVAPGGGAADAVSEKMESIEKKLDEIKQVVENRIPETKEAVEDAAKSSVQQTNNVIAHNNKIQQGIYNKLPEATELKEALTSGDKKPLALPESTVSFSEQVSQEIADRVNKEVEKVTVPSVTSGTSMAQRLGFAEYVANHSLGISSGKIQTPAGVLGEAGINSAKLGNGTPSGETTITGNTALDTLKAGTVNIDTVSIGSGATGVSASIAGAVTTPETVHAIEAGAETAARIAQTASETVAQTVAELESTTQAVEQATAQTTAALEATTQAVEKATGTTGGSTGLIPAVPEKTWEEYAINHHVYGPEETGTGAFIRNLKTNEIQELTEEALKYLEDYGTPKGYEVFGSGAGNVGPYVSGFDKALVKISSFIQGAEKMLPYLIIANEAAGVASDRDNIEKYYENKFGERYTNLTVAERAMVRNRGMSPESAHQEMELVKQAAEGAGPLVKGALDFALGAYETVDTAVTKAGEAVNYVKEKLQRAGELIELVGQNTYEERPGTGSQYAAQEILESEKITEEEMEMYRQFAEDAKEVVEDVKESVEREVEYLKKLLPSNWPGGGGGGAYYEQDLNNFNPFSNGRIGGSLFRINPNGTGTPFVSTGGMTTEEDFEKAMGNAVKDGNERQEEQNDETNRLLRQLLAKNWTINVAPTTGWGMFGRKSNEMAEAVTGVQG